jgi:hypothetical protein
MAFGSKTWSLSLPILKSDDEKKTVTGWAACSTDDLGNLVIDHQGEYMPIEEIAKAAHALVVRGGAGAAGEMHERRAGDLVESLVVDRAKRDALGFGPPPEGQPAEGWAVTLRLDDSAWKMHKSGAANELSVSGCGEMQAIGKIKDQPIYMRSNMTVNEISIVDRGASGSDRVHPQIVLSKRKQETKTMLKKEEIKKALEALAKADAPELVELESLGLNEEQKNAVLRLLEAAKAEPVKEPEPAPAPAPEPMPEPEPVKEPEAEKEIEKIQKRYEGEKAELTKRIGDLEAVQKKLQDEREMIEMVKRAESRPYLSGDVNEQAALLFAAKRGLSSDNFERLNKMLDGANKASETSPLLKQMGSSRSLDEMEPHERLKKMADELREEAAKNGTKITKAKAYAVVAKRHTEIYREAADGKQD